MLIRVALLMIFLCLSIFLLAKVFLFFTFVIFAAFATQLAAFLLLAAFCLLIFGGLFGGMKHFFDAMRKYISPQQREKRHFLFVKNKQTTQKRRFYFQRIQLNYFKESECQYLLKKNNQQHLNALSDSIERKLKEHKSAISKEIFLQLQLKNHYYRMQQNEQALLKLHHKIVNLMGK